MENFIRHFGIFGMKWGIRRFQNEDGTLTEEGKRRYRRSDVEKDFNDAVERNGNVVERISKGNEEIPKMADNLNKMYAKAFKSAKMTPELKQKVLKSFHDEWGDTLFDDRGDFKDDLKWHISQVVVNDLNSRPGPVKDELTRFYKAQKEYWDDVHSISQEVIDKYKDHDIIESNGYTSRTTSVDMVVNDLLGNVLNTSWNAYLSRHFEDYWVNDINENHEMEDRLFKEMKIDMDSYNKKYGK